jgi:hypothetical protein
MRTLLTLSLMLWPMFLFAQKPRLSNPPSYERNSAEDLMRREMARTRMLEAGARQMPDGRLVMPDVYDAHMEKVKALGGDEVIEYPFDYGGPLNRTQSRESQEELRTLLIGRRNFQPWLDVRKPLE